MQRNGTRRRLSLWKSGSNLFQMWFFWDRLRRAAPIWTMQALSPTRKHALLNQVQLNNSLHRRTRLFKDRSAFPPTEDFARLSFPMTPFPHKEGTRADHPCFHPTNILALGSSKPECGTTRKLCRQSAGAAVLWSSNSALSIYSSSSQNRIFYQIRSNNSGP
jgi:hypothetical protein